MPNYQTGKNISVRYKVQSAKGTASSGAGGKELRYVDGPGLVLNKALIESNESRSDGQSTRGRHGSRSCQGTYNCELSMGMFDELLQALFRGTETATFNVTESTMTSITTTTSTIVAAAGSWLTQNVRRGDLVKLTGHSTAGNNGIWFRVTAVSASTITVAGTPLTANAVADTAFTLTVAKTLIMADPPTERYFTFEQYNTDMDLSEQFTDVKVASMRFQKRPDSPILISIGLLGLDGQPLASGASPSFTSPTEYTGRPLVMADGTIRINGTDYADISAFDFAIDLGGVVPPVLAPNPPDVFLDNAKVSGSLTAFESDFTHFTAFDAETQLDIMIHMVEPESDPKDGMLLYMGDCVFDGNSGPLGGSGPRPFTIPFRAGKDEGGSDRAATMVKLASTAAAA